MILVSFFFPRDSHFIFVEKKTYSLSLEENKFDIELTNWAEQANGSVLVRMGDTMVLGTAVMSSFAREGGDFFPLTVDYEEKFYAAGKILGSRFVKRETRPSEEAILVDRMIDRTIRPRFDMRTRNEVQVVITVLSVDEANDPDIPGLLAASLALSLSDIPWRGPVAGIRIGRNDGNFILNPVHGKRLEGTLDLVVSGTRDRINMIEAGASEISENDFLAAIEWGEQFRQKLISFQETIIAENPHEKRAVKLLEPPEEMRSLLKKKFSSRIEEALFRKGKKEAQSEKSTVRDEWMAAAYEAYPDTFERSSADFLFEEEINEIVHRRAIEKGERPDGRKTNEIRELSAEVGVLPRIHGSGLFMRGETHVLSTLTLGAPGDEQIIEGMEIRTKKHFLHHYNFPPFSVGEARPMRGPGRREIGHGALAGKALLPVIPQKDIFPYTIRAVSEALSSNGSTSMGSVSAATLALMDAGVPIAKPVGGIAMGLMLSPKGEYRVLTDLQGPEDHHGDMDFKVAGTRDGITAAQLDVKIEGLTMEIIRDTLNQAKEARMKVLDVIQSAIPAPRPELSPWAPRVFVLKINPEKIGALIGPGGKMINSIIEETGVQIDIEDDGTVFITSEKEEGMKQALAQIKQVTRELKPGEIVEGKITRIFNFGAMAEIAPRQEGMIHISELAPWHVEKVTDIVNQGDRVTVKIKNVDEQGRINLSLKDVPGRYSQEEIERAKQTQPQRRRNF